VNVAAWDGVKLDNGNDDGSFGGTVREQFDLEVRLEGPLIILKASGDDGFAVTTERSLSAVGSDDLIEFAAHGPGPTVISNFSYSYV
jgi:hypothetical protein